MTHHDMFMVCPSRSPARSLDTPLTRLLGMKKGRRLLAGLLLGMGTWHLRPCLPGYEGNEAGHDDRKGAASSPFPSP